MKAPCDQDKLILLWSGELSEEEVCAINAHINGCSSCRAYLNDLRAVASQINELPMPRGTYDFAGSAVEKAFKGTEYRFVWNDRVWLAIAAGLICILGFSLLWSLQRRPPVVSQRVEWAKNSSTPTSPKPNAVFFTRLDGPEEKILNDRIEQLEQDVITLRKGHYQQLSTRENRDAEGFHGESRLWNLRRRARTLRASLTAG